MTRARGHILPPPTHKKLPGISQTKKEKKNLPTHASKQTNLCCAPNSKNIFRLVRVEKRVKFILLQNGRNKTPAGHLDTQETIRAVAIKMEQDVLRDIDTAVISRQVLSLSLDRIQNITD